jgi:hypothetical protein
VLQALKRVVFSFPPPPQKLEDAHVVHALEFSCGALCCAVLQALKQVEFALPATWAAAAASLLVAAVSAASGAALLSPHVAGTAAAAVVFALMHRALVQFKQLFIFTDYVHADVH